MVLDSLARSAIGLLPVIAFLGGLVFLDSYKLVRLRDLLATILLGCVVALVALGANTLAFRLWPAQQFYYSHFGAPLIEELLKGACVLWLIAAGRVGFMIDGAIFGFALGAGFAVAENAWYLQAMPTSNAMVWVLRGFGTAIMHGGTTAIVGTVCSTLAGRRSSQRSMVFLPAIGVAFGIHSLYNLSVLGPVQSAIALLVGLPLLLMLIFMHSEKAVRKWLCEGLDADIELLTAISAGGFRATRASAYLQTLKVRFPPEVVADMFCLLQVSLELSARAKAELMTREAGFKTAADPEVKRKLEEMEFLHRSIGPTGKLALAPLLATSGRDVWQLRLLK